jgi:tRNA(Ile)-lysidine synthase
VLNIDRNKLILARTQNQDVKILVELEDRSKTLGKNKYHLSNKTAAEYVISSDKEIAALDRAKLKFPLLVRYYEEGDSFNPLGMNGSKNLSDFLIDIKMPVIEKKQQQVIVSGSDIIWVVGERIDNRYKVTSATKEIFEIKVKKI